MSYSIFDLKTSEQWAKVISYLPENMSDVYYQPDYYHLYEVYGDGQAQCFVYKKNNDYVIYPYLINSINKLGYELNKTYFDIQGAYGYNGIIATNTSASLISSFHKSFNQFCLENNIIAEFSRFHPLLQNYNLTENKNEIFFNRKTVFVDLNNDLDSIISCFSKTNRQEQRMATKEGVVIKVLESDFDVNTFIQLYTETMKRVNATGYLYFNDMYFYNLFKINNIVQFVAEFEGNPIASAVCFYSKDFFHYHLSASKKEFQKLYPNNLLVKEMIIYAKLKGCKFVHLGGGNTSELDDSLLKFKMSFSKTVANFYIGKKVHNELVYNNVIEQWKNKHPEKYGEYKNMLLGYRNIE